MLQNLRAYERATSGPRASQRLARSRPGSLEWLVVARAEPTPRPARLAPHFARLCSARSARSRCSQSWLGSLPTLISVGGLCDLESELEMELGALGTVCCS